MINIFENYIMNKSYRKVLIFGGTTEGRGVAERLLAQGVPCTVSVATQYGEEVMEPHPLLEIHTGRLEQGAMAQLMRDGLFCCVIDATHPHAQEVSAQIRAACEKTGLPCLRLQRETCVTGQRKPAEREQTTDVFLSMMSRRPAHIWQACPAGSW